MPATQEPAKPEATFPGFATECFRTMIVQMNGQQTKEDAIAILQFLKEAGVDTFIGNEPMDRFAAQKVQNPTTQKPPENSSPTTSPAEQKIPSDQEAAVAARTDAESTPTLEALREALDRFEGCGLKKTATKLVFGDGNPKAKVMLIGEAPGRDEDLQGVPFVGRSGQLLDRMLAAIGKSRDDVYITNILPWRPPGNRKPTPVESEICFPFLARHVELVAPEIIVALGDTAARQLFHTKVGITKSRGKWYETSIGRHSAKGFATFHPAYLLRTPAQKRLTWQDLLTLKAAWPEEIQTSNEAT